MPLEGYDAEAHLRVNDEFLRCPRCGETSLTMDTSNMEVSHGIVPTKHGAIIPYCCASCGGRSLLGLMNENCGRPQLVARINWVRPDGIRDT